MSNMTFDWGKFDKQVDMTGIQEQIDEAAKGGDFQEIPEGEYEVKVKKMELGQSKKGDPMLKIQFEILAGKFKGQLIFYNGVMQPGNENAIGFQIHKNNELLRALADDESVQFKNFKQYNDLILDIAEEISGDDAWEYALSKTVTDKGYDVYEIVEIFEN